MRVQRLVHRMAGAADTHVGHVQVEETGLVRQAHAVGLDLLREAVVLDVAVEQRVVLRFRLEGIDPGAPGRRRPDGVHADIGAAVDQDVTRLEARDPLQRPRLLAVDGLDPPAGQRAGRRKHHIGALVRDFAARVQLFILFEGQVHGCGGAGLMPALQPILAHAPPPVPCRPRNGAAIL
jgi:hypothetical protein